MEVGVVSVTELDVVCVVDIVLVDDDDPAVVVAVVTDSVDVANGVVDTMKIMQ